MKVIIAGSRDIPKATSHVLDALELAMADGTITEISEVVSGTAKGVDQAGENVALWLGVPVKKFPADWDQFGKSAGVIRNVQMAEYADALVAVWDGKSAGTKNMIDEANKRNLKVYLHIIE